VPDAEQALVPVREDRHGAVALARLDQVTAEGARSVTHLDLAVRTGGLDHGPQAARVKKILIRRFPMPPKLPVARRTATTSCATKARY
jgi:hypothetical protein